MFEMLKKAMPDPIIGLTEAFKKDTNPQKINLSVGVFKDANGQTSVLDSVKEAERRILDGETSKSYPPLEGVPEFAEHVLPLLFGVDHALVRDRRAVLSQTTGGTGGLRVCADYLKKMHNQVTVWLSDPTWANHPAIFKAAGIPTKTYAYFDAVTNALSIDQMIAALEQMPAGDVVLLHGCCHNPTGTDPTSQQWGRIGRVLAQRELLPLVDIAYQGFGRGIREDAQGVLALADAGCEMLICSSYSKNFALYNERVGALTVVAHTDSAAQTVLGHFKASARANYSFPPTHGAKIVATVLGDAELRTQWEGEVKLMRDRIRGMRDFFVKSLAAAGVESDFSFVSRQNGMFCLSGLSKDHVAQLREGYSIYIVGSGRINVAGMTEGNMDRLCQAIAAVLQGHG